MHFVTYLSFDGRCEEAFHFYEKVFRGKIEAMLSHEGTPAENHVPVDWKNKIMHAKLVAGNAVLMGGDRPPGSTDAPRGFSVSIHLDENTEAERLFAELGEGGTVLVPLEPTFWAARFGMLTDRYGTPWMINCGMPEQA